MAIRLLHVVALTIIVCGINQTATAQACATCTQTLSNTVSSPIWVNDGDWVCLDSSCVANDTIFINGGSLCNKGSIQGTVFFYRGQFNNENSMITNKDFIVSRGMFTNNGRVKVANAHFLGGSIYAQNNGYFEAREFKFQRTTGGFMCSFYNQDSMSIGSYYSDSTYLANTGWLHCTGTFWNGNKAQTVNSSDMLVDSNFINDYKFTTTCIIGVGSNWTNNATGMIIGDTVSCGGFTVNGISSNTGVFGSGFELLDMCDQGNPGNFDSNTGSLGPNSTFCSCSNSCSPSTGIHEEGTQVKLLVYPNPAENLFTLQTGSDLGGLDVKVYDIKGALILQRNFVNQGGSRVTIDVTTLEKGAYIVKTTGQGKTGIARMIKH